MWNVLRYWPCGRLSISLKGLKDLTTQTYDYAVPCVYKFGYIMFITLRTDIATAIGEKCDHRPSNYFNAYPNPTRGPNTTQITTNVALSAPHDSSL